jgi:hypothetical protein
MRVSCACPAVSTARRCGFARLIENYRNPDNNKQRSEPEASALKLNQSKPKLHFVRRYTMGQYVAPLRDMQFVLHEFLNVSEEFKNLPAYQEIDADIINQVLEEGAKFTQEVLFPLNHSGDREGCHFDAAAKTVTTPKGFKEAYKQYVAGGWAALACDPEYGGQGLPVALNNSFYEMLNSSNQAWSMYPGLSHGAYECLKEHGTDEQKSRNTCRSWSRANGPAPCA